MSDTHPYDPTCCCAECVAHRRAWRMQQTPDLYPSVMRAGPVMSRFPEDQALFYAEEAKEMLEMRLEQIEREIDILRDM